MALVDKMLFFILMVCPDYIFYWIKDRVQLTLLMRSSNELFD